MATVISRADGNWTTASTWSAVATGSNVFSDSEGGDINTTAQRDSNSFVPPASEIDAIGVKVNFVVPGTGGSINVILRNSTTSTDVATVNVSVPSLPSNFTGWLLLPITPHTPSGDTYIIRISAISGATGGAAINFHGTSTNTNVSHFLRLSATGGPASGDQIIIAGEYSGGALGSRTVTMDNTATTTFGAVVATYPQAIYICAGGKLTWANSASTNYYLRFKGIFAIVSTGVLEMYTATSGVGSLPSTSTAVLEMDCTAAGDSLVRVGRVASNAYGGTWTLNGQIKGTTGTITGATNATPIEITDVAHGYETGAGVVIEGVTGNTAANGTWWIRKTGTDTYTLDNSAGNGAYVSGGTRTSRMASKMQEVTTIGTDTVSMGCLVGTSGGSLEWKEGQKFDTGWTGLVSIQGSSYYLGTISTVPDTTHMTLSSSPGAGLVVPMIKMGTGAPKTLKLGDTGFIAAGDILTITSSSAAASSSTNIVSSVDSATQVTLENVPGAYIVKVTNGSATVNLARGQAFTTGAGWNSATCSINGNSYTISSVTSAGVLTLTGNYSQASDDLAYMEITTTGKFVQIPHYHSGLNDTSTGTGDCRAEVVNISRNVMVRSLGQAGLTTGLFGLIQIYSTDAVVTWNYGEFSLLGSGTSTLVGIYCVTTTLGAINIKYCSFHDFWQGNSAIFFGNASGGYTFTNNTLTNMVIALSVSGTSGVHTITGNIFIQLSSSGTVRITDVGSTFTHNTIACGSVAAPLWFNEGNVEIANCTNNTIHSCLSGALTVSTGTYGVIKRMTIWRLAAGNIGTGSNAIFSPIRQLAFSDIVCFGFTPVGINSNGVTWNLIRPNFQAGVNIVATQAFICQAAHATINIIDGLIGTVSNFSTACIVTTSASNTILLFQNSSFGGTVVSGMTTSALSPALYISSIKHNGVAGDNRVWLPNGPNANSVGTLATDTTLYVNNSPSVRCYPGVAASKVQMGPFYVPVKSGVNPTITVKIRKSTTGSGDSASYNGNQPRLALIANTVLGYSLDTTLTGIQYSAILATCAGAAGSWETLSTQLPTTPTADGVVAIAIDFDGTTGWINVDDFKVLSPSTYGTNYWHGDFAGPMVVGGPAQFCINSPRKMNKVVADKVGKRRKFNPAIFAGTGFVSVSGAFILNVENLLSVSSTSIFGAESTLAASNTLVVSIEELLQVLNTLETSNEHTITTSSALVANIEELLGVSSTTVVNEESTIALSQTLITNEENTLGVSQTSQLNEESILGVSQTNVLNEENTTTASKELPLNEENILSTSQTEVLPNEHLLATNQTLQMTIEELLGVSTAEIVNVEWSGTAASVSALIELNIENTSGVMQANALSVEYLLQVTKLMSVAQVEQLLQANGNVSVNFECLSVIQSGNQLNLEVLATVTQTEIITLEQLLGVYNTEALSVEMLAKLSQIEIIPVEWDGVSGFVDGNELKWAIGEQGVVWTLKGDQPTWLIKSNGRTYIIKR